MEEQHGIDLSNVDKVNNIETARMALRWALERLHALEAAKLESGERAARDAKWRAEAEEEVRRLKATISLKHAQQEERERYYKKVEEFLSLRLAGQVDIAALAKREVEVAALRKDLEDRVGQLEREFAARRQSLELEYQRLSRQAREAAQSGAQEAQAWVLKRQEEWEKEHASKLVELKERELRVAKAETDASERQRRVEEFASAQKLRLDAQAKELEEQAQLRLRTAERLLEERQSAQESGWTREKALLLQELALLRRKVQELSPSLFEADRKAEDAMEALARAQEAQRRAEQKARLSQLDRQAEQDRLKELETQVEAELSRRAELEKRLSAAGAAARDAESKLAEGRLRLAEREANLDREREAFRVAELEKDAPGLAAELRRDYEVRLASAEVAFGREKEALLQQLQERETRLADATVRHEREIEEHRARLAADFDDRQKAHEEQTAEWERSRIDEAGHWRRRLEEASTKIAELEARRAQAESDAKLAKERAKVEAQRRHSFAEHEALAQGLWREEWEAERKSLLGKLAGLEEALTRSRDEKEAALREAAARAEAERLVLEERAKRDVEAAKSRQASWDETHVREAAEWRERAEEAGRRLLEFQERLSVAEEAQRQAKLSEGEVERHRDEMIRRLESVREKEHQDFERLLSERDQNEAKLHEELRATKLALEDSEHRRLSELDEQRGRLKQELEETWKARLAGEESLGERLRGALERVSELEKILAQNDAIVHRAQRSLADDAERHKRLQTEAAEAKERYETAVEDMRRQLEERETALVAQFGDREVALNRRAAEIEAAASRAAADYLERRKELESLKAELERQVTEIIRKAR